MAVSGSFGWLQVSYEIDDDHVTLSRNVWLPWLVVGLGVAAPCVAIAIAVEVWMLSLAGVVAVAGLVTAIKAPWRAPSCVVFSRRGLTWGPDAFTRWDISSARTVTSRGGTWALLVTIADGRVLRLSLGTSRNWGTYLDGAIVHVLADRRGSSRLRSRSDQPSL